MPDVAALSRAVFGDAQSVLWWQECARAVLLFLYGLALVRIAGRRVFGKWAALDIIVSIIVGSNLSRALTGNAPLWGTICGTTVLMALHWALARAAAHWPAVARLVEGMPVVLAHGGQVRPDAMRSQSVTQNDLDEALRGSGVEQLGETSRVTLEPSGKVTVLKRG